MAFTLTGWELHENENKQLKCSRERSCYVLKCSWRDGFWVNYLALLKHKPFISTHTHIYWVPLSEMCLKLLYTPNKWGQQITSVTLVNTLIILLILDVSNSLLVSSVSCAASGPIIWLESAWTPTTDLEGQSGHQTRIRPTEATLMTGDSKEVICSCSNQQGWQRIQAGQERRAVREEQERVGH